MLTEANFMNSKRQIYIVHGYRAKTSDHWFDWLKSKLENDQIEVSILAMPDSANPRKEAWLTYLKEHTVITPNTYFIAHSLGCIATLLFLSRSGHQIKGAILLSGFLRELPEIPELNSFIGEKINFENIIQQIPDRLTIAAEDDYIVPFSLTEEFAKAIQAPLLKVSQGGHFLGADNFKEFPLLLTEAEKMLNS